MHDLYPSKEEASAMRSSGWHRQTTNLRHPRKAISCTWFHDNGARIYSGRPYPDDPKKFVYLLVKADGAEQEFRMLGDARAQEAVPKPPKPAYRMLGHTALPRNLRVRNTQTGEYATVKIDDVGGEHRIALGGCSYELEWVE